VIPGYGIDFGDDTNDASCCDSKYDCVAGSGCYNYATANDIRNKISGEYSENDYESYCALGSWMDCDASSGICTKCGHAWIKGGEGASFGEYDTGASTECCGDDPGEHDRSTKMGDNGPYEACRNSENDCVDFNDNCISNDGFVGDYICKLGSWERRCESYANQQCQIPTCDVSLSGGSDMTLFAYPEISFSSADTGTGYCRDSLHCCRTNLVS